MITIIKVESLHDEAKDGRNNHLTDVVDKECHKQSQLFTVIVRNQTDWFHVLNPLVTDDHVEEETPLVFCETNPDLTLIVCVQHNVNVDHFRLIKHFNVKLLFEELRK